MRDLIAKIFRPNSKGHSGTAWLASEKYVLTAFHCIETPAGDAFPASTRYRLKFESGLEAEAALVKHDENVDVALLEILGPAISTKGKIIFGKLPHGEAWARYRSFQHPTWQAYGYPAGYELGLSVDGTIDEADANVAGRISGQLVAIQLTCEHGGREQLNGISGAAVTHNGNVIGIIRSGPRAFGDQIIHAVSMETIAKVLEPMQEVIKQNFLHAISIVAPNILNVQEKVHAVSSDEERRSSKTITNLPRKVARAYGRQAASIDIHAQMLENKAQFLGMVGPDGIGKRTLALEVANNSLPDADSVFLIDLYPVQDERAMVEIANTLGVKEAHEQVLEENLIAQVCDRKIVLVVFYAERLKPFEATIDRLLGACPNIRLVAVARQRFGWAKEKSFEVGPLPLPPMNAPLIVEALENEPTIQLFVECLRLNDPAFALNSVNTSIIVQLCNVVGGSRLGISLMAALSQNTLATSNFVEVGKLCTSLDAYPPEDFAARHRALIAMVFTKLPPELQLFLCRIAVFKGGCSREAAIEIDRTNLPVEYPTGKKLEMLVSSSLIFLQSHHAKSKRYGLPIEVREYCLDHVAASGDLYAAERDHAEYFWRMVNQIERRITLIGGDDIPRALEMLEEEYSNIIVAFTWLRNSSACEEKEEMGLSILANLFWFWNLRGSLHEGRALVEGMLKRPARQTETYGAALYCAGGLSFLQGDFLNARSMLTRSIAVLERTGNDRRLAYALVVLGMVALHHGEPDEAFWHEQRAVHLFEQTDNSIGLALATNDLANVLLEMQRTEEAEKSYLLSFKLWKDLNNVWGMGLTSSNLGHLYCRNNEYDTAERWLRDAMAMQQGGRYQWGYAESVKRMGYVALAKKNFLMAAGLFYDSLVLHRKIGRLQLLADCLDGLAEIANALEKPAKTGVLLGAAEAIRGRIGVKLNHVPQQRHNAIIELASKSSADAEGNAQVFKTYLDQGKAMSVAEASKYAAKFVKEMQQTV